MVHPPAAHVSYMNIVTSMMDLELGWGRRRPGDIRPYGTRLEYLWSFVSASYVGSVRTGPVGHLWPVFQELSEHYGSVHIESHLERVL